MNPRDVLVVSQDEGEIWVQVLRTLVPRTALLPYPGQRLEIGGWKSDRVCGAGGLCVVTWLLKSS